jgi:hypothetical protein
MNFNKYNQKAENPVTTLSLSLPFMLAMLFIGFSIAELTGHRQYSPGNVISKDAADMDDGNDAIGMEQYFFNARKNISTNKMDYQSMLAADMADRAMRRTHSRHIASSLPDFGWTSLGPTATGGRTRAILIDNQDPTHQTIFAGGVSGGIWKSTNGGSTWGNTFATLSYSINDTLENINVSCIAQDANGAIYIGTGEGFTIYVQGDGYSTGMLGGGIFKSTDDGKTWRLLTSTAPTTSTSNKDNVTWAYVNRIAIRPDNIKVIYAATQGGLMVSHDSGTTWGSAVNCATNKNLSGTNYNSLDVKISNDGSVIMACIGAPDINFDPSTQNSYGYYCYPQNGNDSCFTQIPTTGLGHLNGSACRIEFAISPTDPNRVYASVINNGGFFGTGGTGSGIFMTETAKTNGGYWYEIGPGGSMSFDPYLSAFDQANYDNTLGVFPANEGELLCGGTTLWLWVQANSADTVGSWNQISHYNGGYTDPKWIHADEHAIVFDQSTPTTVYIGCDGGIFKSTNMNIDPAKLQTSISSLVFAPYNRNYDVTQYYTVCYSPYVNYVNVDNNNTTTLEGLGVGGGTQDNGSPYVNGSVNGGYYPNDAQDMSGGDGAGAAVSQINPNIAYFCSDYGDLLREGNLPNLSPPTTAYTQTIGKCEGGDIDSAHGLGGSNFVFPVALYENAYDTLNHDSVNYVAAENDTAGTVVYPEGINGTYPYPLPKYLAKGDTIIVPDRVVSRLAVGFAGSYGGIWVNGQAASNATVIWIPVGGPDSKPTAFTGSQNESVHSLAWSADGNALFAGTEGGQLFRFLNMNAIIANNYCSGALWWNEGGIHGTGNTAINSTQLNLGSTATGRDILSIATDPNNPNNVMVTLGNYGETDYVYYSGNALATTPTFTIVQGNLPYMPVYSSILDLRNSNGTWSTNSAMIATEHGIYSTDNITASSVVWRKNDSGMANCLSLALKQQTLPTWECNNSGDIYLGTHGRGLWVSTNNYQLPTSVQAVEKVQPKNDLMVYPNPMTNQGNIEFSLATSENIIITVYDMLGKNIKMILSGTQSEGNHIVQFETTGLPAGTYFVSLKSISSGYTKVNKFVVVK